MNQLYQVEITDLAFGGEGVGRIENMVCFVPFTVPGDVAQVEITQQKKKFMRGRAVSFDTLSPQRVEAPCPYFGECGGCQWQHIEYPQQLESKRSHLQHLLKKSAGIECSVPAPLPSPQTYEYRRSARLKVNAAGEVGFFREHSNTVVPIDRCIVLEPALNREIPALKAEIAEKKDSSGSAGPAGLPLEVELSSEGGSTAQYNFLYQGQYSKQGFLQANRQVNRMLQGFVQRHIERLTADGDTVLDLFCGDGNLSLPLSGLGVDVIGYDISRPAIAKAKKAAAEIPAGGFTYRRAPYEKIIRTIGEQSAAIQAAILDPPRQGLTGKAAAIAAMGFPAVLYISCIPAILARDLLFFVKAGYEIAEIQPMDMFPHTYHLETAVVLTLPV